MALMRDPSLIVFASIVFRVHVLKEVVLGLRIEGGSDVLRARLDVTRGRCLPLKQPVEALAQPLRRNVQWKWNAQGQLGGQVWLGHRQDLVFWGSLSYFLGKMWATLHTICPLGFWQAIGRQDLEYSVHMRFGPVLRVGDLQL
jgi:hypothetical protein